MFQTMNQLRCDMNRPLIFYFSPNPPHRYLHAAYAKENPAHPGEYFTESLIYTTDLVPNVTDRNEKEPEKRLAAFRNTEFHFWFVDQDHREIPGVQEATEYWMPWNLPGDPPKKMTTIGPLPEDAILTDPALSIDNIKLIRSKKVRQLRNELLKLTDHFVLPDYQWSLEFNGNRLSSSFTEEQLNQLYKYRQELRMITEHQDFPFIQVMNDQYLPFPKLPLFMEKIVENETTRIVINSNIFQ